MYRFLFRILFFKRLKTLSHSVDTPELRTPGVYGNVAHATFCILHVSSDGDTDRRKHLCIGDVSVRAKGQCNNCCSCTTVFSRFQQEFSRFTPVRSIEFPNCTVLTRSERKFVQKTKYTIPPYTRRSSTEYVWNANLQAN